MISMIDRALNRITMYRLMLSYLIALLGAALLLAFGGFLPYDPYALLFSAGFLVGACALANALFAWAFGVAANAESTYISALILALIITPIQSLHDLWFLGWAAVLAMASKYILAIRGKHLFNPVALAVAVTALAINQTASWWVGDAHMLPLVLLGGLLIVRKLRRAGMVLSFLLSGLALMVASSLLSGESLARMLQATLLYSPVLFFASVFLTEPLTMPPTHGWQLVYGALVGLLFSPQFHIGGLYTTPEIALLVGNLLAFLVGPKAALTLTLSRREQVAPDIYDFIFTPARRLAFAPGQYMEWTLGHDDPDSRGNRRFFTLASAPTESTLRVGVKFYPQSSSFKQALLGLQQGDQIAATQLAGDFTLPRNPNQKCVFIAGGIGITPFRSMLRFLLDTHQRRPIVVFYTSRTVDDQVYRSVLEQARRELGIKTVYTITHPEYRPNSWDGPVGYITPDLIRAEVPDYQERLFYISGPNAMVDAMRSSLLGMGVSPRKIKTDSFAGLA